jgi:hypothetical protein
MKNGLSINSFRTKRYYKDNLLHREDGPAVEYTNGIKCWYIYGKYHRIDGPAIKDADGAKYWYLDDKQIDCKDNEEFLKIVKFK